MNLRQFIRDYLVSRKEVGRSMRAMLNLTQNSRILVEQLGECRQAIVHDVDCSLEDLITTGKVRHFTPKAAIKPRDYISHECSEKCLISPLA